jgi:glycosyltransferase involved in cell wall biosynthesis
MHRDAPRVVVVTSRLDVGGAERHLTRVLPALKRRGIDISLYVMERGGALEAELLTQGVCVDGPMRARWLHWPKAALALARWLRRERPTIIHFFLPRPYVYGSMAAELAGHRRRIVSRRSLTNYRNKYPLLQTVERLLHRRTLGVIGNSKAVLDQLRLEVGDYGKLALIHNGIALPEPMTPADRQETRLALGISEDAIVITAVANLVAYKGHRDLLAALALVKDELPVPWQVLAIGRNDGIGAELEEQAETLNIAGNIRFLGERSDVGELLAASDIFVLPSHQEGFSNALLEAMAANVPAVATAVGGNTDAVVDNETGLLVPAHDPKALGAAILRLAKDSVLRRRLAGAARRRAADCFSLDACVGRYERLYRALNEPVPHPVAEVLADTSADNRQSQRAATIEHAH